MRVFSAVILSIAELFVMNGGLIIAATKPTAVTIPITFEQNRGQFPAAVLYAARGGSSSLAVTDTGAVLGISGGGKAASVSMRVEGARAGRVEGYLPLPGVSNYFTGTDQSKWIAGVPQFGGVRVSGVKPGVDLLFYASGSRLEYDVIIAPGRDPSRIALRFEGQRALSLDRDGNLVLDTAAGEIRHLKPRGWQEADGVRRPVEVRYELANGSVGFRPGAYDPRLPLVIDPVVVYSTYFPATVNALATDAAGNVYLTGEAAPLFAPTPGAYDPKPNDAFVAKVNAAGTQLLYATYLGGLITDWAESIAVDASGNAYVAGTTNSPDFPVTPGALKSSAFSSIFVAKLNAAGSALLYSATVPGSYGSTVVLTIDSAGNAYFAGCTTEPFPVTSGAYRTTPKGMSEGFVGKLNPAGTALVYGTYLGGSGYDFVRGIAVDSAGAVYLTGATSSADFPVTDASHSANSRDAFVTKLKADGSGLLFSTLVGGSGQETGTAVAVDSTGAAYVAGITTSASFPTTPGVFGATRTTSYADAFLMKYSPTGAVVYSTIVGPLPYGEGYVGVAVDGSGNALAAGTTQMSGFPVTPGALMETLPSSYNMNAAFLTVFDSTAASVVYSTLFGGRQGEAVTAFALGADGTSAYLAGTSNGAGLPTSAGALQTPPPVNTNSGFLLKIDLSSPTSCAAAAATPSALSLPATGSSGCFDLNLPDGCPWVAVPSDIYQITVAEPSSGIGKAKVSFSLRPTNLGSPARNYSIKAGSATVTITQAEGSCANPVLAPASLNFSAAGGLQNVAITIPTGCLWTAASLSPWLRVTSPASGTSSGAIQVFAQPSNFGTRSGSLQIGGVTVPVTQAGGTCTLTLAATQVNIQAAGGTGAVQLATSGNTCPWNIVSLAPWISVINSSGTRSGVAGFLVAANPLSSPRTGSLYIEGQLFSVSQTAGPSGDVSSYLISTVAGASSLTALSGPGQMEMDSTGNLYFIDNNRVRKMSADGTLTTIAGGGLDSGDNIPALTALLQALSGLAVDGAGVVYLSDGNRVRKVGVDGQIVTIAGGVTGGSTGDGGPASAALLKAPSDLALDAAGNLLIADTANFKIRSIGADGKISTFAGTGTSGSGGDGGPALSAQFQLPAGLFVDKAGNVYVSDSSAGRVRKITLQGVISKVAGGGTGGDGGPAGSALLNIPRQIWLDPAGNLYIAEANGYRIRRVALDGTISTIAGNGSSYPFGDNLPATGVGLSSPVGVVAVSTAEIYLSEQGNRLIRKLTPAYSFCSYSLSALPAFPFAGGSATVSVTAAAGCPWSVVPGVPWLTVNPASGVGNGTVTVTVAPTGSNGTRSGVVNIGGQNLTVSQAPPTSLRFVPVTPCRVVDTRLANGPFGGPGLQYSSRDFAIPAGACGIPQSAAAYSLNVTVVPAGPLGYLTIWPAGQPQPMVSTLNSPDGRIKANAAIVPAGAGGAISVFGSAGTDVVLDVNGYFVASSDPAALAYYPLAPCRVVDTRLPAGALGGPSMEASETRSFGLPSGSCGVPLTAKAYSLNYTVVPTGPLGYLTTWPTGGVQPSVSTLNALSGSITANAAIVPAGPGGAVNVYTSAPTHVVIDINGYFAPPDGSVNALSYYPTNPCRVFDTRTTNGPVLTGQRDVAVPASVCGLPATAKAYSLNATVVPPAALGYLTLWPSGGTMPVVSTLNALEGGIVSNAAIVPTLNGSITAFASATTELILDANGYFAP